MARFQPRTSQASDAALIAAYLARNPVTHVKASKRRPRALRITRNA